MRSGESNRRAISDGPVSAVDVRHVFLRVPRRCLKRQTRLSPPPLSSSVFVTLRGTRGRVCVYLSVWNIH